MKVSLLWDANRTTPKMIGTMKKSSPTAPQPRAIRRPAGLAFVVSPVPAATVLVAVGGGP